MALREGQENWFFPEMGGNKFLVEFVFIGQPKREKDYFYHSSIHELILIDDQGKIVSRGQRTEHYNRISFLEGGADSPLPFAPLFLWAVYEPGKVLFSEGLGGKFHVYDLAGHLVKEIETPLPPPAKVTGRDLARWRQERKERIAGRNPDWWARFGRVIEKYRKSIYAYKPNIFSLTRTAQGNFLVSSNREATNSKAVYWLLNSQGKVLAKIETKLWILGISPHFIFFGGLDKEELPFIKAWKRQGTEAEDLLSFQRKKNYYP